MLKVENYKSFGEALRYNCNNGNFGIYIINDKEEEEFLTYKQIYDKAVKILYNLQEKGIKEGDKVIFQMQDNKNFILYFWACILGKIIPVPVNVENSEQHKLRLYKMWNILEDPYLITDCNIMKHLSMLAKDDELSFVEEMISRTLNTEDFLYSNNTGKVLNSELGDTAIIQFSSGSTGDPKGVVLTHENILRNVIAAADAANIQENEFTLSWLPLTHNLGLIAFHILPCVFNLSHYIMPTVLFIKKPMIWMDKIHEYKITTTASPNFGFKHFLNYYNLEMSKNWDLSTLRVIFNGAEPVSASLCKEFLDVMSSHNLSRTSIVPGYGMTETTLTIANPPLGEEITTVTVERESLNLLGGVRECPKDQSNSVELVDLGYPIKDCYLRVCDNNNNRLDENIVGYIQVSGKSISPGYYNNLEQTQKLINNGWLNTGDVGFIRKGRLIITGRVKDIIFVNGKNYYPSDIEKVVAERLGATSGGITCCGVFNKKLQTEDINIYIEFNAEFESFIPIAQKVKEIVNSKMGLIIKSVIPIERIPKTSSGKVQRYKLSEMHSDGKFDLVCDKIDELFKEDISERINDKPTNEIEEKLVRIWNKIFFIQNINTSDNFFMLGGNSIKAIQLLSIIHKEFNIELPISVLFKCPTIKKLEMHIEKSKESIYLHINPIVSKEIYETSSVQKRLYSLNQMDKEKTNYNVTTAISIKGNLDRARVEESFRKLIERHEAFRTSFELVNKEIVQKIHNKVEFNIEYEELQGDEVTTKEIMKNFIQPFDLSKTSLIRVKLLKIKNKEHILMVDMHHIISDGKSIDIVMKEFAKIYSGEKLDELLIQYKDYAAWQNIELNSEEMRRKEEIWLNIFSDDIPVLDIPTDYPRSAIQTFEGNNISFKIGKDLVEKIKKIENDNEATLYMMLLSVYNIMLSRYSRQEDIIVGSPIAGRTHADLNDIVGMFVNTVAIRNFPQSEKTFKEFLQEVKVNSLTAYENQEYQFDKLIEKLHIKRELSRNPLFDVVFVLQNNNIAEMKIDNLKIDTYKFENKVSKFDITLSAAEVGEEIEFDLEYCTSLFNNETAEKMGKHFINILKEVLDNPDIKIADIEMISEEEKREIMVDFNRTYADYPKDKTINELFEEQVEKNPDNLALVFNDIKLTYRELNERANRVAHALQKSGLIQENIVGIIVERSVEMIVGILGILKAGGAYLPIDPEYPVERIEYMLKDSRTKILLSKHNFIQDIRFEGELIDLDNEEINLLDGGNLEKTNLPQSLAYIIYTSGTTGMPKGVMIEHKNVVRLLFNEKMQFDFNEKDVWTMFHSYCFDFSVWEMFGALLYGGKLVLISKSSAIDTEEYLNILNKERVTVLNQIPTPFYSLMNKELNHNTEELNLRYVIFGGEALKPEMLREWKKKYPETKLINMYGITETTVHVTFKEIGEEEINKGISNIGKPIPTLTAYIMDKNSKLLPIGVPGELCVGGEGIARGYLNRDELTKQKFIFNPYKKEERIYKSGDLARILYTGDIEYLGRIDHQVKIRGFRIELGEIESKLLKYDLVKEAVVITKEGTNNDKYLCAYVVSDEKLTVTNLRTHLLNELPEYMIPSYFIQLEKMPVTSNGKIDRKVLLNYVEVMGTDSEYTAPRNKEEDMLVNIWSEVLSIEKDKIGIKDNFFEIGGDSIRVISLISLINKAFNGNIEIKELYMNPTIEELSEFLKQNSIGASGKELIDAEREALESIKQDILIDKELSAKLPSDIEDLYPMSNIEQGMIYHSIRDSGKAVYHDQLVYQLKDKNFDLKIFEKAMSLMVSKHDILRTSFNMSDFGIPIQLIHKQIKIYIEQVDITDIDKTKQVSYINEYLNNDKKNPFDISNILWRIKLFKLNEENICLVLIAHHAILDGWSVASCVTELLNICLKLKEEENYTPIQLKHSYRDFILDQMRAKKDQNSIDFWKEELRDYKRVNLNLNNLGEGKTDFAINNLTYELNQELLDKLKNTAKKYNVSVRTLCFAAYSYMINMFSYENDIIVGMVENNRPACEDGEKILGCFLNTVPVRIRFNKTMTWEELIEAVGEKVVDLKLYGRLPLLEIMDAIEEQGYKEKSLFEALFNYVDFHVYDGIINSGVADVENKISVKGHAVTDSLVDFTVNNTSSQFQIIMNYSEAAFTKEQARLSIDHFVNILNMFTDNPKKIANKLDVLTSEEKEKILVDFNHTNVDSTSEKTVYELFEQQVEKTPDNVAAVYEGKELTYRELNERANRVANVLKEKGVGTDKIVGIIVERSLEMLVGILAILKAGGAYIPIDADYPKERIEFLLDNSSTSIVLTSKKLNDNMKFKAEHIIIVDEAASDYRYSAKDLNLNYPSDRLMYVLYTSGSTGNPKGVMVKCNSFANLLNWFIQEFNISSKDNMLLIATVSFDLAQKNLYATLVKGGKLFLFKSGMYDYNVMSNEIEREKITLINCTPSAFQPLVDYNSNNDFIRLKSLRHVFLGGEPINLRKLAPWIKSLNYKAEIINTYGPTECTDIVSSYKIDNDVLQQLTSVPIGKPIYNAKLYILDKNRNVSLIGVVGELYVGGIGVSRGYYNNSDLTKKSFVKCEEVSDSILYRTGDLVKWLPDGNIEYLERADNQVKIRGFRIELGEIENHLLQNEGIKEAVVVDKKDKQGNKYLCAYIACDSEMPVGELRKDLSQKLPNYMIPAHFMQVEKMPLTPNGKLDRKALPEHDGIINTGVEYVAPRNEIDKKLVDIWSEYLVIKKIGIDDDFFSLGGHSLKAIQILSIVHKELNVEVPVSQLFSNPTIRQITEYIEKSKESKFTTIKSVEEKEVYKASLAQKRIFALSQLGNDTTNYNIPNAMKINGNLEKERVELVFKKLIEKHEAFRTSFELEDDEVMQRIHKEVEFNIEYGEISSDDKKLVNDAVASFVRPFDLSKAPLMRLKLVKAGTSKHILILDMHHIISDGSSMGIIMKEFTKMYKGESI